MTSGFATYHLVKRRIFNQKLISRGVNLIFIDATSHSGITLWVKIDHQYFTFGSGHRGGQIDTSCCFPNSAFLIGDCYDFTHGMPRCYPLRDKITR
ncbi:Uncharacterised protein [Vibrio cholerae]|uniref:Uncharacterized protein n=1 Tax=Vibrio cholerae TaxID=666 RepID=A0A656A4Z4_VIBCL|nr:Uncharacterised protein [Vibrio cholerae]CSD31547.1 Uncharacterised protein [Vibrio cholerae]